MKLNLTYEQECDLCYLIDDWYIHWKKDITDGTPHKLGIAKEELKALIVSINSSDGEYRP